MAFFLQGWGKVETSSKDQIYILQAIEAAPPQVPVRIPPRTIGCFRLYNYYASDIATGGDEQNDIDADGYFDLVRGDLQVGDIITAYDEVDLNTVTRIVTSVNTQSPYIVTQRFDLGTGEVVTADFNDGAVTYAKIQNVTSERLLGNAQIFEGEVEEISIGNGLIFDDPFLSVIPTVMAHASGTISAAEWNDMYNTPIQLVPVPDPDSYIIVDRVIFRQIYGGAQYTGGGTVIIGYDEEPTGLSEPATSNNISAATINNIAATSMVARVGFTTPTFMANMLGVGIYISNQTAAFATGDGDWEYNIWYKVL